jgi:hypothetical protein
MRIIRDGRWALEFTCPVCRYAYAVECGDVQYGLGRELRDENDPHYYAACPNDGTRIRIEDAYIPASERVAAKARFQRDMERSEVTL